MQRFVLEGDEKCGAAWHTGKYTLQDRTQGKRRVSFLSGSFHYPVMHRAVFNLVNMYIKRMNMNVK